MKLMAVTDDSYSIHELASYIIQMMDMADIIHIREKRKNAMELVSLLKLLKEAKVDSEKIVINDRLDVALLMGIPNIHLPSYSLPVKAVRAHYPHMRIGRSVHSLEEAKLAEEEGADYVLFGHIFATNSKRGKPPQGMEPLTEIMSVLTIPVYAIGGISPGGVPLFHQSNVDGIAVMSGIFASKDPVAAAQSFYEKCQEECQ